MKAATTSRSNRRSRGSRKRSVRRRSRCPARAGQIGRGSWPWRRTVEKASDGLGFHCGERSASWPCGLTRRALVRGGRGASRPVGYGPARSASRRLLARHDEAPDPKGGSSPPRTSCSRCSTARGVMGHVHEREKKFNDGNRHARSHGRTPGARGGRCGAMSSIPDVLLDARGAGDRDVVDQLGDLRHGGSSEGTRLVRSWIEGMGRVRDSVPRSDDVHLPPPIAIASSRLRCEPVLDSPQ